MNSLAVKILEAPTNKMKDIGQETFVKYLADLDISNKVRSAKAIWQVGKGDGVYLEILNKNGQVRDWELWGNG